MKKTIFLLFLGLMSQMAYSQNPIDDYKQEIKQKLKTLQLQNFKGRLLSTFLETEIACEYKSYSFSQEPPAKLSALALKYADRVYVYVYFKDLKHQEKFNKLMHWSFEKLRKEVVARIELVFE